MAFYDNEHWLLCHIRNSFIAADDTGMSEIVMMGEDMCKRIKDPFRFPGLEESDDEEHETTQSLDNYSDLEFGLRRHRSNTAARLEKLEKERSEEANVTRIKWHTNRPFNSHSDKEKEEMFGPKDLTSNDINLTKKISLLTIQLEKYRNIPPNKFQEFSKFDGNAQVGVPTRKYGVYITSLKPIHRGYPLVVTVLSTATVQDFIGLILWKCSLQYPDEILKEDISHYGLYIAEDDGEVDFVFPCLDHNEKISKFLFKTLALVEHNENIAHKPRQTSTRNDFNTFGDISSFNGSNGSRDKSNVSDEPDHSDGDVKNLHDQVTALEASLYMSYKVFMINKVRSKTEVHLGISGEKIEIDPIVKQNSKFLSKKKPKSYNIDSVVACDILETKSSNRTTFRLVYEKRNTDTALRSFEKEQFSWNNFKHYYFETDKNIAQEIVQKVNHILQLRCSARRMKYISRRERKSHRSKRFPNFVSG